MESQIETKTLPMRFEKQTSKCCMELPSENRSPPILLFIDFSCLVCVEIASRRSTSHCAFRTSPILPLQVLSNEFLVFEHQKNRGSDEPEYYVLRWQRFNVTTVDFNWISRTHAISLHRFATTEILLIISFVQFLQPHDALLIRNEETICGLDCAAAVFR